MKFFAILNSILALPCHSFLRYNLTMKLRPFPKHAMDSQAGFLIYDTLTVVCQVQALEDCHQSLHRIQLNYKHVYKNLNSLFIL